MSRFDSYRKWLGIPEADRPPTLYQLLGIAHGEADRDVIEEAAIRQTTHVRAYQLGEHAKECAQLLNEISQARITLVNPDKRKAYEAEVAQKAPRTEEPKPGETAIITLAPRRVVSIRKPVPAKTWIVVGIGAGTVFVLVVVGLFLLLTDNRPGRVAEARRKEVPPASKPPEAPKVRIEKKVPEIVAPPFSKKEKDEVPKEKQDERVVGKETSDAKKIALDRTAEIKSAKGGTWLNVNGGLVSSNVGSQVIFGDPDWADIDLSFKVTRLSGDRGIKVLFRIRDERRYNAWLPDRAANGLFFALFEQIDVKKGKRLSSARVGKGLLAAVEGEAMIRVSLRQTSVQFFVNEKTVLSYDKLEIDRGRIGFMNPPGHSFRVEDVVVRDHAGKLLWEGLPLIP